MQAKIYKYWLDITPPSSTLTLSDRLAASFGFNLSEDELKSLCEMLVKSMKKIPKFVQVGYYRSCHNAWNTSKRYGGCAPCKWCGVVEGDCIGHYLKCSLMLSAMHRICPILVELWVECLHPPLLPKLKPSAFCIGVQSVAWASMVITWHDLLHHCYNISTYRWLDAEHWFKAFGARRRVWHRMAPATSTLVDQFVNRA